jgi:hypothetical protein
LPITYLLKKEEIKLELVDTYRLAHVAETISLHLLIMSSASSLGEGAL